MAQSITIGTIQIMRSFSAAVRPTSLLAGQEFVNFADGIRLVGDGGPVANLIEQPLAAQSEDQVVALVLAVSMLGSGTRQRSGQDRAKDWTNLQEFADLATLQADAGPTLTAAFAQLLGAGHNGGGLILPDTTIKIATQAVCGKVSGKQIDLIGRAGSAIDVSAMTTQAAIYSGSPTVTGGGGCLNFRGVPFIGGGASTGLAVTLENASLTFFDRVLFTLLKDAVTSTGGFALRFLHSVWNAVGRYGFQSDACHNTTFSGCAGYTVGVAGTGEFAHITGATDNLSISQSTFEGCRRVANFTAGGTSFSARDVNVESCTASPFEFGATMYNPSMTDGLFYGGVPWQIANTNGGELRRNKVSDQAITFATSVVDLNVGNNRPTGSGSIAAAPYQTLTSFTGSWVQGTKPVGLRRDDGGRVWLTGDVLSGASSTNGTTALTLPAGYAPPATYHLAATISGGGVLVFVSIGANGNVVLNVSSGFVAGTTTVSLDGLNWQSA